MARDELMRPLSRYGRAIISLMFNMLIDPFDVDNAAL